MKITINFDMDGTIANLYGVSDWLEMLRDENPAPYKEAVPLINMSRLAKALNKLTANGIEINVISWGSKDSSNEFLEAVRLAKINWLSQHLPSVKFSNIFVVPYGTPKTLCVNSENENYLFDDEIGNRENWEAEAIGQAFSEENIFEILKEFM